MIKLHAFLSASDNGLLLDEEAQVLKPVAVVHKLLAAALVWRLPIQRLSFVTRLKLAV
jgi:hypothetical protein